MYQPYIDHRKTSTGNDSGLMVFLLVFQASLAASSSSRIRASAASFSSRASRKAAWLNQRQNAGNAMVDWLVVGKTIGKWWLNGGLMGFYGSYPLAIWDSELENHHFQAENPLFLWSCSIVILDYQRVNDFVEKIGRKCKEKNVWSTEIPDSRLTWHRLPKSGHQQPLTPQSASAVLLLALSQHQWKNSSQQRRRSFKVPDSLSSSFFSNSSAPENVSDRFRYQETWQWKNSGAFDG